jgi:hypothetical protein
MTPTKKLEKLRLNVSGLEVAAQAVMDNEQAFVHKSTTPTKRALLLKDFKRKHTTLQRRMAEFRRLLAER